MSEPSRDQPRPLEFESLDNLAGEIILRSHAALIITYDPSRPDRGAFALHVSPDRHVAFNLALDAARILHQAIVTNTPINELPLAEPDISGPDNPPGD